MTEMKNTENSVVLIDEEGKEVEFDHLLTFMHEDSTYIALMPMEDVEGIGEDEVLLLKIVQKNGEDTYVPIENEALLEEVFEVFSEIFEEKLDEEDLEDEQE